MALLETLFGFGLNVAAKAIGAFLKDQPIVEVSPDRFMRSRTIFMNLAVTNPTGHRIEIRSVRVTPCMFLVWRDSSIDACVDAIAGVEPSFILDPGETRKLPLQAIDRRPEWDGQQASISVYWRSLRRPRRPQFPVTFQLTHADYDRLQGHDA